MTTHIHLPLKERLKNILTSDATLDNLLLGTEKVFDNPPRNELPRYITFGEFTSDQWDSHTNNGFQGSLQLDVWTNDMHSSKPCHEIQNRIYQLLHRQDLEVSGYAQINFECSLQTILKDDDGVTHHGVQRFSFIFGGN